MLFHISLKMQDYQRRGFGYWNNEHCGQVSMIMRLITGRDGDLFFHFDEIDESHAEVENTSLKHLHIYNHDIPANKGEKKDNYLVKRFLQSAERLKRLQNK